MADGEAPYVFKNPAYDDNDGDDDDQEVNRTGPIDYDQEFNSTWAFGPGAASTPGEQYEMQTMMHEQSGLPDASYEETPLLGAQSEKARSWDALTRLFPKANATDLETSYSANGRLQVKMSGYGKKTYPLFTTDRSTKQTRLNPSLTNEIKDALGKSAEEIIAEDRETIREQRQRLAEAENQQRQAEELAAKRLNQSQEIQNLSQQIENQQRQAEELAAKRLNQSQEIQNLSQQIERTQARIDTLQEEQGSNLESEAQLNRLKQLKKIIKLTLKKRKKN